jgi:Cytochrome c554 and c-prime
MRPACWVAALTLALLALPLVANAAPIAGDQVCAGCHEKVVARFRGTPMAKALEPVAQAEILRKHPSLAFQEGDFQWRIVREGDRSLMTVTGNGETITAPLLWAFGRGQAGQTYVFERDGAFYESRVSFYNALGGLDLTMGAQLSHAKNIDDAAGRRMDALGARDCFGCHSAGAVAGGRLHLESIVPGVACESCHGSADQHVAAVRAGNPVSAKMAKLSGRTAEEMAELCGRCHRTWSQIALSGPRGVLNVRFQPYRLTNSKCWDTADARIACSACHDPHGPLETSAAAYDARCSACHSAAQHTKTCRVAKANCVTCHMPKIELPGAHARFTDHQIRIVRAGEPYPN